MIINQQQIMYITILAIIIIVFFNYNKSVITEGLDPVSAIVGGSPQPDEANSVIDNKDASGFMTDKTTDSKIDDIASQIKECETIISEINEVLPRRLEDITIGTVNQTENLEQVGFTIEQGVINTLSSVTGNNEPTGTWKINAILPRGKQGSIGIRGPRGTSGYHGQVGDEGRPGRQGPWGNDCPNNKCN